MTLRTAFFWLHLTAGIVAGAIVLLMSVTGVALTYERQMIAWSDREFKSSPQPGMERMPVERLVQEFRRQNPGQEPTAVTVEAGPSEPVAVTAAQRTFYLDAYSGRVLGHGQSGHAAGDVEAAGLAPVAGDRGTWAPRRPRHHGLGERALPVHRGLGHLHVVSQAVDVADGKGGAALPARASRQGQGLQLAQRDRHLVLGSAAHRRGQRRAHLVSVGERAGLPDGR